VKQVKRWGVPAIYDCHANFEGMGGIRLLKQVYIAQTYPRSFIFFQGFTRDLIGFSRSAGLSVGGYYGLLSLFNGLVQRAELKSSYHNISRSSSGDYEAE
jgi:hypothetical protein